MGHRNSWFATPEGAALVDEEGSPHTSNCGTGRCQKSRVSSVCVAGVTRIWKIWWWLDIVLRLPPAAATADDEIGGLPPLPTRVFLSFFLPGTGIGIGSDEVPIPLTARPLIDDLLSPLPSRAPRTTVTTPARGPTITASFTAQPNPTRRGETPSKLFSLLCNAIS